MNQINVVRYKLLGVVPLRVSLVEKGTSHVTLSKVKQSYLWQIFPNKVGSSQSPSELKTRTKQSQALAKSPPKKVFPYLSRPIVQQSRSMISSVVSLRCMSIEEKDLKCLEERLIKRKEEDTLPSAKIFCKDPGFIRVDWRLEHGAATCSICCKLF